MSSSIASANSFYIFIFEYNMLMTILFERSVNSMQRFYREILHNFFSIFGVLVKLYSVLISTLNNDIKRL